MFNLTSCGLNLTPPTIIFFVSCGEIFPKFLITKMGLTKKVTHEMAS